MSSAKLKPQTSQSPIRMAVCLRGRVVKGVGHLDHVRSYGVREVVSLIPGPGQYSRMSFSSDPGDWYGFLIWTCLSFQILNLFRTLSSWGSSNYRPSAPLLYEVASHVKKLPFRPLLLLFRYTVISNISTIVAVVVCFIFKVHVVWRFRLHYRFLRISCLPLWWASMVSRLRSRFATLIRDVRRQ